LEQNSNLIDDMKKLILMSGLVIFSNYSYSQFAFGVKGGININELSVSGSSVGDPYKTNMAFHVGVYAQLKLSDDKLSLIPELQFSQRGANVNGTRINLNYLELPILISYKLNKQLRIELGPTVGYKISAVAKGGGSSNNVDAIWDKNFDLGIAPGIRFYVSEKVSIIGRYYYGISPASEVNYLDMNANPTKISTYNRTIQLGVGYRLK
jgi:hypothetical protein